MANIASQKKRIARSRARARREPPLTSTVKTHFRRLEAAVEAGDDAAADAEHKALARGSTRRSRRAPCTQHRRPQEVARRAHPRRAADGSRSRGAAHCERERHALRVVRAAASPPLEVGDRAGRRPKLRARPRARAGGRAASPRRGASAAPPRPRAADIPCSSTRARGAPRAAASPPVDQRRHGLALVDQPLGGGQRARRVAVDERVGERPGDLLGGVGDHRLEVGAGDRTLGPAQSASRSSSVASRAVASPIRSTSSCAASGSSSNPRRPASATSQPRQVARLRRRVGEHLAARGLDRVGELLRRLLLRRLLASDEDDREVGRQPGERLGDRSRLPCRPALDAVGEQIAAARGQRHRRDRGDQRLGVGPSARAGRRRERLERPRAALGLGAARAGG